MVPANLSISDKQRIFDACVVSKLLYGLESICFRKQDFKKIDAFYCRCLRKIHKIPHSYLSHIPNQYVYDVAKKHPIEYSIFLQQIRFYGKNYAITYLRMVFCVNQCWSRIYISQNTLIQYDREGDRDYNGFIALLLMFSVLPQSVRLLTSILFSIR